MGKICYISDLHLGYQDGAGQPGDKNYDCAELVRSLDKDDQLVFLGDTFDLWRRNLNEILCPSTTTNPHTKEIIQGNLCLINAIAKRQIGIRGAGNTDFIVGNHDYTINETDLACFWASDFHYQNNKTRDGSAWHCTHGYEFEALTTLQHLGVAGYEAAAERLCREQKTVTNIASYFWGWKERIFSAQLKRDNQMIAEFVKSTLPLLVDTGESLVYGHTHEEYLDMVDDSYIVNAGSFGDNRVYVEIEDDEPRIMRWVN